MEHLFYAHWRKINNPESWNGNFFVSLTSQSIFVLCLLDSAGGLAGYEILKVHDADPFLGVEVKFVEVAACQQFLESYSSGAVLQSLCQHASRLLSLSRELRVETQLKASTHILDLCLDNPQLCLQHIHLSQVHQMFSLACFTHFEMVFLYF